MPMPPEISRRILERLDDLIRRGDALKVEDSLGETRRPAKNRRLSLSWPL
jgi:hypothetical protein